MNQNKAVELLYNMLQIYSPSGKEAKLALFLKKELLSLGFLNVYSDKVGNVYGEIGFGTPTIMFCGHMDTVKGKIPVKLRNGRLYGRGAVDAKSSLAAMISTASQMMHYSEKGRIILAGLVEEELNAKGIRQLLLEKLNVDFAVFGEPSGLKKITFAYKGRIGLEIICKTSTGHIGAQHLFNNTIEKSFQIWKDIKYSCEKYRSKNGIFYSVIPTLTNITSKKTSGVVPNSTKINIDLRIPPKTETRFIINLLERILQNFRRENPTLSTALKIIDTVEPYVAPRETLVMKALKKAIFQITGEPARFIRKTGTGDMNIFGSETGIPVATYGPGDSRLCHTKNEYVDIVEYLKSIQVYVNTVHNILSA